MGPDHQQKFVLFSEDTLFASEIGRGDVTPVGSFSGNQISDFGHVIAANSVDARPDTDYVELATAQTHVSAAWNDRFLFFDIVCDEPRMDKALAYRPPSLEFEHDFRAREDVQIHLDVSPPSMEIICLSIGIDGRLAHRRVKPEAQWRNTVYDERFDVRWDAAVSHQPGGWWARVKIPFAGLGVAPKSGVRLGINFTRNAFATPEFSTWKAPGYWMNSPERMGRLVLTPSEPRVPPSPTVILISHSESDGGEYSLATRPPSEASFAVNDAAIPTPDTRFQLTRFQSNRFRVSCNGVERSRSIPVESDATLSEFPAHPIKPVAEVQAELTKLIAIAEAQYCGGGVYKYDIDSPTPTGMCDGIHRPDLSQVEASYAPPALMASALLTLHRLNPDSHKLARAKESLDWLVSQQRASGAMPVWMKRDPFAEESTLAEYQSRDSFYMNGLVGRAMLDGFAATRDEHYLAAAIKLGEFNAEQPPSHNANYTAFCLLFQPELSRVTGDARYLHDAVHKWECGIRRGQMLSGEWTGHNRLTNYMGIIGWGIGSLAAALPVDSATKIELRARGIRMLNCFYRRLSAPGALRQEEEAPGLNAGAWASQALLTAITFAKAFDLNTNTFASAVAGWIVDEAEQASPWARAYNIGALAEYIRWRQALRRGETIQSFAVCPTA